MKHIEFKNAARRHQIEHREQKIKSVDYNKYQTWLTDEDAKSGKNFFNGLGIFDEAKKYRPIYFSYPLSRGRVNLFSDMLRSEHIPFNLFVPFKQNLEFCKQVFNEILGNCVQSIDNITIEYAPKITEEKKYLNDRTSFDTYIEYTHTDNLKGIIAIEVKYTEKEYPLLKYQKNKETGEKELTKSWTDVENFKNKDENSIYLNVTKACKLYKEEEFMHLVEDKFRQIWRNHLLVESILIEDKDEFKHAYSLIFYPKGNEHFTEIGKEYSEMLADNKKDKFGLVTFENFIKICRSCKPNSEFEKWIDYLQERYIVK